MHAFVHELLSVKFIILFSLIAATIIVHYRGKVRYKFFRQLTDHSTFMAPINVPMYALSGVENKPYINSSYFPQLDQLKQHWETIRDEAILLEQEELIKGSDKYNDVGFNSFFRRGWKRFYLKWYGDFHPSAIKYCPQTVQFLKDTPTIKAAMFAVLPAGSQLMPHRDPYAGSLRYHLGLITPNSADCHIVVDGQSYAWKDGEDVLFDETYIHYAENKTDKDRLILFCDIERPVKTFIGRGWNKFFGWFIMASAASPNMGNDKTGNLNKIFKYIYSIRLVGKRLKAYNERLYYAVKYALMLLIIYALFLRHFI
ncbi:aspartyl/asparaginyl beta-hydroxylase domain-containing protein [Mucilaginibacter sp. KACC 22063]|uniref:aspartyl/asparaginyl beta-hydroxylase domain-containing protein n=1 Tax=Mucilaginibacter sp. KACC 22063 TaxID=3025666 RepID=UPI0023651CA7|nr:aspartyl/asparaginyl beta-hydroxylase domain-containing protein [Mucilaginibacter sp. KACC 22063]WDF54779.1 aspartyl/asparaginyl beta-hydroxylase domain-containing protein [Mucilaginibacter sp. KACC 22063]